MNPAALIDQMSRTGPALVTLARSFDAADRAWKPADGAWSCLEIVCHLVDEDNEDFGARLRLILQDPALEWPAIDPEGWARDRRYNERDFDGALAAFASARGENVAWLRSLGDVDWSVTKTHPRFGSMSAGELLGSWAAHDVLHLRQLTKRLYQITQRDAGGADIGYAGAW